MARQSKDVEILVHVAAPSRTADDVTYRRLAQAYLSFTADRRTRVASIAATDEPERSSPAAAEEPPPSFQPPRLPSSSQGYATAAPDVAFGPDSQDLSFQSAWDNRSSPCLPPASHDSPRSSLSTSQMNRDAIPALSSFCVPPSQISDSYPLPDPSILQDTPTRILQRFLNRPRASTDTSTSPSPSKRRQWRRDGTADNDETIDVPSSFPAPTQDEVDSNTSVVSLGEHKVIPVTPLVPHLPPGGRKRKTDVREEEQSVIDVTHISSSVLSNPPTSSPHRAGSEPLPSKKAQTAFGGIDALSLLRSSSDTGRLRSSNLTAVDEVANRLEIRPPSPPIGVDHVKPQDLVTDRLAKLALDLSSRYHPVELRPVEPLERGYWLIDCSRWSSEKRLEAWVFLTNYLHKGLAGWGVWCRRDAAHGWIRLYCWGCVVKHTYLLLYLASARQIKTTRAKWIGSDGEMALEVPARDRRS
ncbi:hypothetical protein PLIIFM63780_007085 [Purpureocillium lilacinum]|uniref:Uncharacterized protein n=1 Tax=Purpureocillium lilacinum TaxID=33203 RepID=A0A2U3DSC6_PURLI|nr:hypothetical protein Purlil1_9015 [Purpureocillium lilacinum]PWI65156.1 hypothetical protein PCL_07333 [Purpureocillium lilacinum]GJN73022.1 hypothetical protein PLICBS_007098 [Purpureocillium lilacinum]GJN83536.1 hypothetical protein PLIIFM63780_007085 [Purpureocillium lilacinum]